MAAPIEEPPEGSDLLSVIIIAAASGSALDACVASVCRQTYRPLELVLFANGGSLEVATPVPPDIPVRRGQAAANLGVARGRNAAAQYARGELLLFLDDDATLDPCAAAAAVGAIEEDSSSGAVAFRVVDPATDGVALWYYPYEEADWGTRPFYAPWVIGCGHLVRAVAFRAAGGFWPGYFREAEEIDLSWRLIDEGWAVRFEPAATVRHPERTQRHLQFSVASNLMLVWRLLPAGLAARQTVIKLAVWLARAIRYGELRELAAGMALAVRGLCLPPGDRRPLKPSTVRYLRRVHAGQGIGKRLQWSLRPLPAPDPLAPPVTQPLNAEVARAGGQRR